MKKAITSILTLLICLSLFFPASQAYSDDTTRTFVEVFRSLKPFEQPKAMNYRYSPNYQVATLYAERKRLIGKNKKEPVQINDLYNHFHTSDDFVFYIRYMEEVTFEDADGETTTERVETFAEVFDLRDEFKRAQFFVALNNFSKYSDARPSKGGLSFDIITGRNMRDVNKVKDLYLCIDNLGNIVTNTKDVVIPFYVNDNFMTKINGVNAFTEFTYTAISEGDASVGSHTASRNRVGVYVIEDKKGNFIIRISEYNNFVAPMTFNHMTRYTDVGKLPKNYGGLNNNSGIFKADNNFSDFLSRYDDPGTFRILTDRNTGNLIYVYNRVGNSTVSKDTRIIDTILSNIDLGKISALNSYISKCEESDIATEPYSIGDTPLPGKFTGEFDPIDSIKEAMVRIINFGIGDIINNTIGYYASEVYENWFVKSSSKSLFYSPNFDELFIFSFIVKYVIFFVVILMILLFLYQIFKYVTGKLSFRKLLIDQLLLLGCVLIPLIIVPSLLVGFFNVTTNKLFNSEVISLTIVNIERENRFQNYIKVNRVEEDEGFIRPEKYRIDSSTYLNFNGDKVPVTNFVMENKLGSSDRMFSAIHDHYTSILGTPDNMGNYNRFYRSEWFFKESKGLVVDCDGNKVNLAGEYYVNKLDIKRLISNDEILRQIYNYGDTFNEKQYSDLVGYLNGSSSVNGFTKRKIDNALNGVADDVAFFIKDYILLVDKNISEETVIDSLTLATYLSINKRFGLDMVDSSYGNPYKITVDNVDTDLLLKALVIPKSELIDGYYSASNVVFYLLNEKDIITFLVFILLIVLLIIYGVINSIVKLILVFVAVILFFINYVLKKDYKDKTLFGFMTIVAILFVMHFGLIAVWLAGIKFINSGDNVISLPKQILAMLMVILYIYLMFKYVILKIFRVAVKNLHNLGGEVFHRRTAQALEAGAKGASALGTAFGTDKLDNISDKMAVEAKIANEKADLYGQLNELNKNLGDNPYVSKEASIKEKELLSRIDNLDASAKEIREGINSAGGVKEYFDLKDADLGTNPLQAIENAVGLKINDLDKKANEISNVDKVVDEAKKNAEEREFTVVNKAETMDYNKMRVFTEFAVAGDPESDNIRNSSANVDIKDSKEFTSWLESNNKIFSEDDFTYDDEGNIKEAKTSVGKNLLADYMDKKEFDNFKQFASGYDIEDKGNGNFVINTSKENFDKLVTDYGKSKAGASRLFRPLSIDNVNNYEGDFKFSNAFKASVGKDNVASTVASLTSAGFVKGRDFEVNEETGDIIYKDDNVNNFLNANGVTSKAVKFMETDNEVYREILRNNIDKEATSLGNGMVFDSNLSNLDVRKKLNDIDKEDYGVRFFENVKAKVNDRDTIDKVLDYAGKNGVEAKYLESTGELIIKNDGTENYMDVVDLMDELDLQMDTVFTASSDNITKLNKTISDVGQPIVRLDNGEVLINGNILNKGQTLDQFQDNFNANLFSGRGSTKIIGNGVISTENEKIKDILRDLKVVEGIDYSIDKNNGNIVFKTKKFGKNYEYLPKLVSELNKNESSLIIEEDGYDEFIKYAESKGAVITRGEDVIFQDGQILVRSEKAKSLLGSYNTDQFVTNIKDIEQSGREFKDKFIANSRGLSYKEKFNLNVNKENKNVISIDTGDELTSRALIQYLKSNNKDDLLKFGIDLDKTSDFVVTDNGVKFLVKNNMVAESLKTKLNKIVDDDIDVPIKIVGFKEPLYMVKTMSDGKITTKTTADADFDEANGVVCKAKYYIDHNGKTMVQNFITGEFEENSNIVIEDAENITHKVYNSSAEGRIRQRRNKRINQVKELELRRKELQEMIKARKSNSLGENVKIEVNLDDYKFTKEDVDRIAYKLSHSQKITLDEDSVRETINKVVFSRSDELEAIRKEIEFSGIDQKEIDRLLNEILKEKRRISSIDDIDELQEELDKLKKEEERLRRVYKV